MGDLVYNTLWQQNSQMMLAHYHVFSLQLTSWILAPRSHCRCWNFEKKTSAAVTRGQAKSMEGVDILKTPWPEMSVHSFPPPPCLQDCCRTQGWEEDTRQVGHLKNMLLAALEKSYKAVIENFTLSVHTTKYQAQVHNALCLTLNCWAIHRGGM